MKILSEWTVRPGCLREAVERNLAGKANPPAGVKLLGRWYATDSSCGCAVYETDDMTALAAQALEWADLLEITHTPVIDDAEAGPLLVGVFGR